MTTFTAWFLIVSGVTYGGFVSYSPPMPNKAACEKFKQNLYPSLHNESNFVANCVENTIYVPNATTAPIIPSNMAPENPPKKSSTRTKK